MRKLKVIFATMFASMLMSGCSNSTIPAAEPTPVIPAVVEVESITTTDNDVVVDVDDYYMLEFTIHPYNASDKRILVDTSELNTELATVIVDSYTEIYVCGIAEGSAGIVKLMSTNGKSVSYTVSVVDHTPEPEEELSPMDKIAKDFNASATEAGYEVSYYDCWHYWWLRKDFGVCEEQTQQVLGQAVYRLARFLPDYMFRYTEKYDGNTYTLVMVNSNISAASDVCGFIEDEHLIVELIVYSVW